MSLRLVHSTATQRHAPSRDKAIKSQLRLHRGNAGLRRAAVYVRLTNQESETQLRDLRRYVRSRGWAFHEYLDHEGTLTRESPGLDRLCQDAGDGRFDVLVSSLSQLGFDLPQLVKLLGGA